MVQRNGFNDIVGLCSNILYGFRTDPPNREILTGMNRNLETHRARLEKTGWLITGNPNSGGWLRFHYNDTADTESAVNKCLNNVVRGKLEEAKKNWKDAQNCANKLMKSVDLSRRRVLDTINIFNDLLKPLT